MIELQKINNLERILQWRSEVLTCVFGSKPGPELIEANRHYFLRHANGFEFFTAFYNGMEAGCGAVCFYCEMPSPDNPTGRCAYLMNIYVRPEMRGHGVASAIVERLKACARHRACGKIYLETTPMARSLYQSNGFAPMNDYMAYARC